MNNTEIEDGEVYSDNEEPVSTISKSELDNKLNSDEKNELNKLIKYDDQKSDLESGELSENPYDEEDETMIELKMKALKSLLDKGDSSTSKVDNKKSKFKKKKVQQRSLANRKNFSFAKKEKKVNNNLNGEFSPQSQQMSNGDNYNLEEMEIEEPMQQTKNNTQIFAEMMVKMMMMSSMPSTSANIGNFMMPLQIQHQSAVNDVFNRAFDFNNISPSMLNPLQLNAMAAPEPNWHLNNNSTSHSPGGLNFMPSSATNHLRPIHQNKFNPKKGNFNKKNKKFKNAKRLEHNLNNRTNPNSKNHINFNNQKAKGKFTSPNLKTIKTTEQPANKSNIQYVQKSPPIQTKPKDETNSSERFDIDERFVDKQSHTNDVDYRQFAVLIEPSPTAKAEAKPEQQKCDEVKKEEEYKEGEKEQEEDDDDYINELRKKLLDNVNEKRLLKKQENN